MATRVFKVDSTADAKRFARAFVKGIELPIKKNKDFFKILGTRIDRDVQTQFRTEGAGGGPRGIPGDMTWKPFSARTLQSSGGTFRLRPGTDHKPGQKVKRRYSFNSKLLQASGSFKKSFGITGLTNQFLKYQTRHKLGGKIGASPFRPVLFVLNQDIALYSKMYKNFIDKGIKF